MPLSASSVQTPPPPTGPLEGEIPAAHARAAGSALTLAGASPRLGIAEAGFALVAAILTSFAGLAYTIVRGGFLWDDWQWVSLLEHPVLHGRFANAAPQVHDFRPLLADWIAVVFRVFGHNAHLHLAFVALLAACTAWAFYLLLRTLGVARTHAAAMALLMLVFPWSDSTRVYTVNGMNAMPVCLFLFGLTISLHGLRRRGLPAGAMALAGTVLYALSVLTYEVAAVAALAAIIFYVLVTSPRRALARWALDLAVVGAAVLVVRHRTEHEMHSLRASLGHGRIIAEEGLHLLGHALTPFGAPLAAIFGALLAALAVTALARLARGRVAAADRAAAVPWLIAAVVSAIAIACCYAVFVPADLTYSPLHVGIFNRVNILAGLGYVVLVYALVMLVATLLRGALPRRAPALAACLLAIIGIGYGVMFAKDQYHYADAHTRRQQVLDVLRANVADPVEHGTIYTFNQNLYAWPGIPLFSGAWDLRGAVRVLYHDSTLRAQPVHANTVWACRSNQMYPKLFDFDTGKVDPVPYAGGIAYGLAIFVNVQTGEARSIGSQRECVMQGRHFLTEGVSRFSDARKQMMRRKLATEMPWPPTSDL